MKQFSRSFIAMGLVLVLSMNFGLSVKAATWVCHECGGDKYRIWL